MDEIDSARDYLRSPSRTVKVLSVVVRFVVYVVQVTLTALDGSSANGKKPMLRSTDRDMPPHEEYRP